MKSVSRSKEKRMYRSRFNGFRLSSLVVVGFAVAMGMQFAVPGSLLAGLVTWNGTTDVMWDGSNWTGGTPEGNDVVFNAVGAGNLTTELNGTSYTINSLTFNADADSNVSIGSSGTETLTIGSAAGITVDAGSAAAQHDISANVILGVNQTWTNNSSSSLLLVSGVIGDSGSHYSLTKDGAGILRLTGDNTFDGGFTLRDGTVQVGSDSALGSGGYVHDPWRHDRGLRRGPHHWSGRQRAGRFHGRGQPRLLALQYHQFGGEHADGDGEQ